MFVFFFQKSNDIYFKQIYLLPLMNVSFSVYYYVHYVVLLSGGVKTYLFFENSLIPASSHFLKSTGSLVCSKSAEPFERSFPSGSCIT